jgi:hypothetical protein
MTYNPFGEQMLPPFVTQDNDSDRAHVLIAKLTLANRNSSIVFGPIAWTLHIWSASQPQLLAFVVTVAGIILSVIVLIVMVSRGLISELIGRIGAIEAIKFMQMFASLSFSNSSGTTRLGLPTTGAS